MSSAEEIVLFPTDTLYGLGVDATHAEAVLRLQKLKGRESGKPISIIVSDMHMAEAYAEVTPLARRLAERFLPGKLTLVLNAKKLPEEVTAGTGTVGIRIPDHSTPHGLVTEFGTPITATSANISGMETKATVQEILEQFGDRAHMVTRVIDGGIMNGAPSTVVDARGDEPVILREGAISEADIRSI